MTLPVALRFMFYHIARAHTHLYCIFLRWVGVCRVLSFYIFGRSTLLWGRKGVRLRIECRRSAAKLTEAATYNDRCSSYQKSNLNRYRHRHCRGSILESLNWSKSMPLRILVVGAGAIGAFYGSRLACASNTAVSALCRSNFSAVQANGFRVISPKFDEKTFRPEHVFSSPENARNAKIPWDYLLVSTKSLPDVSDDSTLLEGLVGPKTCIVLIQNGIGIEEPYKNRFPRASILSAVTIAAVAQSQPGFIKHNAWTRISIGPYLPHLDNTNASPPPDDQVAIHHAHRIVELLQSGGIKDAEFYDHARMQFIRWHKVAVNAAMNPSSVLSGGCGNQEMSTDPEVSLHLLGTINEVLDAAPKILGKPLPSGLATAEQVVNSTKQNSSGSMPSMWADWEKGTKMELEVILGNPIRIARKNGIEMPRLQTMYALLRKMQEKRDSEKHSKL